MDQQPRISTPSQPEPQPLNQSTSKAAFDVDKIYSTSPAQPPAKLANQVELKNVSRVKILIVSALTIAVSIYLFWQISGHISGLKYIFDENVKASYTISTLLKLCAIAYEIYLSLVIFGSSRAKRTITKLAVLLIIVLTIFSLRLVQDESNYHKQVESFCAQDSSSYSCSPKIKKLGDSIFTDQYKQIGIALLALAIQLGALGRNSARRQIGQTTTH